MTFKAKTLATGQITTGVADLYHVPSTKRAIVKSVHCYNTGSTTETVKVYIKKYAATATQIGIAVLNQDELKVFVSDGEALSLAKEDAIQGITTTGTTVDFTITGAEEDV